MEVCLLCKATDNIDGHHTDYQREETIPLCRRCHQTVHRNPEKYPGLIPPESNIKQTPCPHCGEEEKIRKYGRHYIYSLGVWTQTYDCRVCRTSFYFGMGQYERGIGYPEEIEEILLTERLD